MLFDTYEGLFVGIAGVLICRFRHGHREFLNATSAAVILVFLTEVALLEIGIAAAYIVWVASAIALISFYLLRFKHKVNRRQIDFLKLFAVCLLTLYPITFGRFFFTEKGWYALGAATQLIIPVIVFIYAFDRFILKPAEMKRKFVIVLVCQSVAILMFIVFGLYQQTLAEASREEAVANAQLAMRDRARVVELEQALRDCK